MINVTQAESVAVLSLASEKTRNELSISMQLELLEALDAPAVDDSVRAVILTGKGKGFCSGAELGGLRAEGNETLGENVARHMAETTHRVILRLRNFEKPVVAAVNGAAAGVGASLALACDIVLAAESAFFMFPFAPRLGLLPDGGSTWHLARRLGPARAMSLALTGARLPGAEAAATGLIAGVQPDNNLLQHAHSVAIAAGAAPQHMVQELRDAFDAALSQDHAGQLEYKRQKQKIMLDSDAFAEGTLAFLEKREPDFRVRTTT